MKHNDSHEMIPNDEKSEVTFSATEKYSFKYRMIKTSLLILAWISFGLQNELVGPTYEDLKILLGINNEQISFALTLKAFASLITVPIGGILLDKFSGYADFFMAVCCLFMSLPNFFIPWSQSYLYTTALFLVQGIFGACHDIGGNHLILALWSGISNSPINAMHAGYGIGMIIAIQLCKPFIRFDPLDALVNKNDNQTLANISDTIQDTKAPINPDLIEIKTPYFICASVGIMLFLLFIAAQIFERNNTKKFTKKYDVQLKLLNEKNKKEIEEMPKNSFIENLLFGNNSYKGKAKAYMLTQIVMIILIQFSIQGHFTIVSKFMLPYLTKGPGKFSLSEYSNISSLFWAAFVASRFIAAFVAFKIDSITFVYGLLLTNLLMSSIFLVPYLTMYKLVFWIGMGLMGFATGPCTPSTFMVAKNLIKNYNSFVLSLFAVSMSLGTMFFQQITGILLDSIEPRESFLGFENFESAYIVSYAFFIPCFISFVVFMIAYFIYRKYISLLD